MSELASSEVLKDWCASIAHAAHTHTPLRIEGFQSKASLSAPPSIHAGGKTAQSFNVLRLHGVIAYEPSELYIQARCGTPLSELEDLLDQHGQCLPFEPPRLSTPLHPLGSASLGGMVAAGFAGPARVSMGGVRDHVLGLGLINGLGEYLAFGGQVIKNVAGYDVSRLLSGSMGRLGVITEVSLKVLPKAASECTFTFPATARLATFLLAKWGSRPLALNASAWVCEPNALGSLLVRLRGARASTQSSLSHMLQDLKEAQVPMSEVQMSGQADASSDFWRQLRDQTLDFFNPTNGASAAKSLWRVSLPPSNIAAFEDLPHELTQATRLLEWHGALQWWWADGEQAQALSKWVHACGGQLKTYRIGGPEENIQRVLAMQSQASAAHLALEQRIQLSFDPKGVFNAQRLGA